MAVGNSSFFEILNFREDPQAAQDAFDLLKPRKGRVDMLSVFAVMVAASDQRPISRVSLFFSIFDLDGSGAMNKDEFNIAVNSLMRGINNFFDGATLPTKRALEEATSAVFDKIDADNSGLITLGELLNYAYRSGELKTFLKPFQATDERDLEGLVQFNRDNEDLSGSPKEGTSSTTMQSM